MMTPTVTGPVAARWTRSGCRERCWEQTWMIDLDVRKFFDTAAVGTWSSKAVQANITHEQRWIVLYVKRWLAAPIVMPDGGRQDGTREPRRVLRFHPCSLTCSCIMRSTVAGTGVPGGGVRALRR